MSLTTEEKVKILDDEILVKEDVIKKLLQTELKTMEKVKSRKECNYLISLLRAEKFRLNIRG